MRSNDAIRGVLESNTAIWGVLGNNNAIRGVLGSNNAIRGVWRVIMQFEEFLPLNVILIM